MIQLRVGMSIDMLPDGSVRVVKDGQETVHAPGSEHAMALRAYAGPVISTPGVSPAPAPAPLRVASIDYETRTVTLERA